MLETDAGTMPAPRWPYGNVGIGGGGGPVLVPISTPPPGLGALFNIPRGPPAPRPKGGMPLGIEVTGGGFRLLPLSSGEAAAE